eukprot:TRINITY_DN418_c0_g1_i1.p1 TRINITY_DN418_c0_g1~~TRINITY_DN418_c0_g1_i1.p1  ORF type:complete len:144 (+),score=44.65 TRINITY_DN418_c0_g1_i1:78-509(+)
MSNPFLETDEERRAREEAADAAEAERLAQHMARSKTRETAAPTRKIESTGQWNISLIGFPTDQGQPVELGIDGKTVYVSREDGIPVRHKVTWDLPKGPSSDVTIKVGVMDFETTRPFEVKDGEHIKFEFTQQGLSLKQQKLPF